MEDTGEKHKLTSQIQSTARAAAGLSCILGLLALVGWRFGLPRLTSLSGDFIPMAPSTAVFFCVFGVILLLHLQRSKTAHMKALMKGTIIVATLLSMILLVLSSLEVRLGIEHLGMQIEGTVAGAPLGHMSPVTAFSFFLAGIGSLSIYLEKIRGDWLTPASVMISILVIMISLILLTAYAMGAPILYGTSVIPPAITTSFGFLFLGTALLGTSVLQLVRRFTDVRMMLDVFPVRLFGLILLAVLLIVTSSIFVFRSYMDYYRREAAQDLISVADLKVHELEQWRSERRADASTFQENELFRSTLSRYVANREDSEISVGLRSWLQQVKRAYRYEEISLLDSEGEVLMSTNLDSMLCSVVTHRVDEVLETGEKRFIDLHRHDTGGTPVLVIMIPIYRNNDRVGELAVLSFCINPRHFLYPLIERWPTMRDTGETLLLRAENDRVVFLNTPRLGDMLPLEYSIPRSESLLASIDLKKPKNELIEGQDYRGKDVIAVVNYVSGSPWTLVTKIDAHELYAPLRSQLYGFAFLVGALILAVVGIGAWAWQRRAKAHYRQLYHVERARMESEERYKSTLQSIGDAVITTDIEGRVEMMNGVAQRLTGWKLGEAAGHPVEKVFRVVEEETGEPAPSPVMRVLQQGYVVGLANHTVLITKSGEELPIADSGAPVRDDSGQLFGVVLVFRDQSEERAIKQRLKENNELLASSQRVAKVGGWEIDVPSMQLSWTEETYRIHEMDSQKEVDIETGVSFFPGEAEETIREAVSKAMNEGIEYDLELPFVTAEGNRKWVRTIGQVIEEDGEIRKVKGIIQDITDRKEIERTVLRQQELLEAMEQVTKVGGWRYELDTGLLHWTKGVYDIYEVSEEGYDPNGSGIDGNIEFYTPEDREKISEAFHSALSDGKAYDLELRFTGARGTEKWVRTIGIPIRNEEGEITGVYGNIMDITDVRMTERQLIESQKMEALGQLAGGIAHDFNNVLTAIHAAAQLLERKIDEPALKKLVSTIASSVKRGNAVTNRMLSFTRSQEPELKPVSLSSFLFEFKDLAHHSLPKNVHLHIDEVSDEQRVYADPVQLQQVLVTLAINSSDAMPDGGKIHITARRPTPEEAYAHSSSKDLTGTYWCLVFSDEGSGMDEDVKEHVFEPFFTTKDSTQGTGLGLAVVYKIVQMHRGWIEADSIPGEGTTFLIGLPEAQPMPEAAESPQELEEGHGEPILIVDDETSIRVMLDSVLSDGGYRTVTAETAQEALELLQKGSEAFDLVLTDIGLPDMNGRELIMKIGELEPRLPIIAMTGYMETSLDQSLYEAGADVVIKKPYDIDELSEQIHKLLASAE